MAAGGTNLAAASEETTYDGLVLIKDSKVDSAYIDPDADFSVYKRVAILEPYVAFKKNWQRDQNQSRQRRVSASDMERIKADIAALMRDVFIEALEANDGYEVVAMVAEDVLLLQPAIIELDINAPVSSVGGRSRSYTTTDASATLYIELFDAVTGKPIGRAADRRTTSRHGGRLSWSNEVTNVTEARRMLRGWADDLREFLDSNYRGN
jgi:hypothetical protein